MASMNVNDNSATQSPDMVICKGIKVIENDKKTADSEYAAYKTLQESKEDARGYKICFLDKAEESNEVYQDIMSCITIGNYKKAEIIQKNIDNYIIKDDEIGKLIKDSSKLLNEMRVKMEDAHNAACAMSNCVKNKVLPKSKKIKGNKIESDLKEILDKTKILDEKGQNAFESAVTIAGIQTFTNTSSLKEFTTSLTDTMKIFKDCITSNIDSTNGDVTTSREELNVIVEELAVIVCDKKAESTTSQGLNAVLKFVCESECDGECLDLCKDIKDCYDSDDDHHQHHKKGKRHKRKQSEDKN